MDKTRLLLLGIALAIGAIGAFFFPIDRLVVENQYNIFAVAISVYPVLFGFSITIIAIVGGLDSVLTGLSWQRLAVYRATFENKMLRQALLGVIYLAVLALALILQILPKDGEFYFWGGKLFIFLAIVSLLCSFAMPFILHDLHTAKYEQLMLEKGAPATP
ncbi:hypothetical protein [Desulfovibrio piger]|uniref:hypothetical protein n=1 Tax=Desulfovibrio piger TaxID=901 RepID=UPI00260D3416|nr:hypothetical protein [Desulfovibrio piger]